LTKHGATPALVAKRIREGLDATKQKEHFQQKTGRVIQGELHIDYKERGEYADRYINLHGLNPTPQEQERIHLLQIQQNIHISPPLPAKPATITVEAEVEE
jgi:hypothetical protein